MDKKVISNSVWMMAEKVISIFGLIFVTSYVAKYVGPSIFGQIALATSLFQITQILSQLGSDVIIFKRISKSIKSGVRLIYSTTKIRVAVYFLISLPIVFFSYKSGDIQGFLFLMACFFACFFTSLDIFSIYYNATLQSKKNTIINAIGLVVAFLLRWLIALFELDPLFLCIPIVLSGLLPYLIRRVYFGRSVGFMSNVKIKRHKTVYSRYLIKAGMTFVLSTLSVAIYTRLSMLSLGYMDGNVQVGIYSVAVTLASSWVFVCQSVVTSSLPSIFSEKNESVTIKKTAKLSILVIAISLPMVIGAGVLGKWFIEVFYGGGYISAYIPMIILSVSTLVSVLGTVSARFIAKYSGYSFLSKKMLTVAILSLFMNVVMIHFWGITGAAIATLSTEIISLTVLNYFFRNGIVFNVHKKMFIPSSK